METQKTLEQGLHYADLHATYQDWIQELEFYKNEIGFFQRFLTQFVSGLKDNSHNVVVEQFQNKLIVQDEQNDLLLHEIRLRENKLNHFIKTHEYNAVPVNFKDQAEWQGKIQTHRKLYTELKQELYHGLTQG